MLAKTPYTEIYLRKIQAQSDEKMLRQRISAAKPKPRQLNRDRHRHLVGTVADILREGQPTNFAFEGPVTHGLRVSLILQGWPWLDADLAAADVVGAALRQIGAVRPTWQQGQIGYTEDVTAEHERCANSDCGKPVVIGLNGKPRKYCSDLCLTRHHAKMASRHGFQRTRAEYLAFHAANRAKKGEGERDCDRCGARFRQGKNVARTYCDACRGAVRRARRLKEKPCAHCGTMFQPRYADAKFCARACLALAFSRPEKQCECCQKVFRPKSNSYQRFCGDACKFRSYKRKPSAMRCEAAE
ncbi:hypothetical protein LB543_27965 [Mesorhizobium sp. ESP7-2]|uniref:hypothetical protein n=1 Tax=Mesorhizobium sp. ESP7-2 TaxID=2876622 RepID=UPI001CCCE9C0|nr:hypothetical protein [Mesorhizobium sp. ESP7-2]MBZ9710538.1 hypothetical protein [Mesorhizobium sp. ESP7-2]